MPLPDKDTTWPPKPLDGIAEVMDRWAAWYVGDPKGLERAYSGDRVGPRVRPSQYAGGVVGAVSRWFWGTPQLDLTSRPHRRLHVPVASDICQASADLLFSDPPVFTFGDDDGGSAAQARWDELAGDGLYATLAEAAELGAALGGSYLRVTWDESVAPEGPFPTAVDADGAWPEFRWGRLVAVTFWTVVAEDGQQTWRHLERHSLDPAGVGVIEHAVYQGTPDHLGRRVPLTDLDATRALADVVDEESTISTQSPGLAVVYVPNLRPQRRWRKHPLGRYLGRSDLDGIEPLMDALDEVYSSWLRDIELGKARIIAAESVLEDQGPGKGAAFDVDRSVFTPIRTLVSRDNNGGLPIQAVQFAIRVAEHQQTARQILEDIFRSAGYSAQTFGEVAQDSSITATEVHARQARSLLTRDRKIRSWRPALEALGEKLLAVDAALFRGGVTGRPKVSFPDAVQESQLALAQTASALRAAQAASTDTLVRMVNPEWDDDQVAEEVDRIMAEQQVDVLPDPTGVVPEGGVTDAQLDKDKADALGALIRAGVEPHDAARRIGVPGLVFTGAIPVSLRPPRDEAEQLEQQ